MAELGALAALTGLVVVAISINLSRILSMPNLPGRAGEALVLLVAAIAVASAALVPYQPATLLGLEFAALGFFAAAIPLANQSTSWKSTQGLARSKKLSRVAICAAATLPFVMAGAMMILGCAGALYWVAGGVIVSLVAGVWNAWILLVEILR